MLEPVALSAALALMQSPAMVRAARRSPLPIGMTFLLEVAAGNPEALSEACQRTDRPDEILREAASFFIEQILLTHKADSYRVLGANPAAPASELRRHMALLLKWLHPDVAVHREAGDGIDRSIFANRVTSAWENLKTEERRAAYELVRPTQRLSRPHHAPIGRHHTKKTGSKPSLRGRRGRLKLPRKKSRNLRHLTMFPLRRESILSRIILFLKGRR